jgi:transposase-like protein
LLTATTVDGEGSLFPLCFAVVDAENRENWMWFMIKLRNLLAFERESRNLTFLSDRQKGIIDAIEEVFPAAQHAHCMRHLAENFRRTFKTPALIPLLWRAAYSTTENGFNEALSEMDASYSATAKFVRDSQPTHWATAYFDGERFGHLTSNRLNQSMPGYWMSEGFQYWKCSKPYANS